MRKLTELRVIFKNKSRIFYLSEQSTKTISEPIYEIFY